jgi:hypothetical protein
MTPAEFAAGFGSGVTVSKVLAWIGSGELPAVNIATRPGGRKPRWWIDPRELDKFKVRRAALPRMPKARRRRQTQADVINFF